MGLVNFLEEVKDANEYGFEQLGKSNALKDWRAWQEKDMELLSLQNEVKRKKREWNLLRRANHRMFEVHEGLIESVHYLDRILWGKDLSSSKHIESDFDRVNALKARTRILDHKLGLYHCTREERAAQYKFLVLIFRTLAKMA